MSGSQYMGGGILFRLIFVVLVPIVAVLGGLYWYAQGGRYISTDNAYIKADMIAISPSIDGRVMSVQVKNDDVVEKGDVLFTLDQRPYQIALDRAEARMKTVVNEIKAMTAEHAQIQAEVADAQERVKYLTRKHERQLELKAKGVATAATIDEVQYEVAKSVQTMRGLTEKGRMVLAELGGATNIAPELHPKYIEALAERDEANLALEYTNIRSPTNGIVSRVQLQPGEWVEEGAPVFRLVTTDEMWIEANLKETQLTHVQIGQDVEFVVDAYPDIRWTGKLTRISPATGSEFMVLPAQNATGNWIKVVQRIPVRIDIEDVKDRPPLRAGMTVQVSVDTKHERELLAVMRGALASIGAR